MITATNPQLFRAASLPQLPKKASQLKQSSSPMPGLSLEDATAKDIQLLEAANKGNFSHTLMQDLKTNPDQYPKILPLLATRIHRKLFPLYEPYNATKEEIETSLEYFINLKKYLQDAPLFQNTLSECIKSIKGEIDKMSFDLLMIFDHDKEIQKIIRSILSGDFQNSEMSTVRKNHTAYTGWKSLIQRAVKLFYLNAARKNQMEKLLGFERFIGIGFLNQPSNYDEDFDIFFTGMEPQDIYSSDSDIPMSEKTPYYTEKPCEMLRELVFKELREEQKTLKKSHSAPAIQPRTHESLSDLAVSNEEARKQDLERVQKPRTPRQVEEKNSSFGLKDFFALIFSGIIGYILYILIQYCRKPKTA